MTKVTYYVGTNDKDTCEKELSDRDFRKVFDELFENYTLQYANGVFTMQKTKEKVEEQAFIITTFVDDTEITNIQLRIKILNNVETMKDEFNQESILVEVSRPQVTFL